LPGGKRSVIFRLAANRPPNRSPSSNCRFFSESHLTGIFHHLSSNR
jgi:hypothetical protein